ncbi:hypothetical protein [Nonomuraea dietziae]|uniref:hypothetical protein n=1 Tax=Nonomuraea dietziae TaxID=65515 RepID=UPI0033C1DB81
MKTLEATPILDWDHPLVARLAAQVRGADDRARLIAAHRLIAARLRPVYAQAASARVCDARGL